MNATEQLLTSAIWHLNQLTDHFDYVDMKTRHLMQDHVDWIKGIFDKMRNVQMQQEQPKYYTAVEVFDQAKRRAKLIGRPVIVVGLADLQKSISTMRPQIIIISETGNVSTLNRQEIGFNRRDNVILDTIDDSDDSED